MKEFEIQIQNIKNDYEKEQIEKQKEYEMEKEEKKMDFHYKMKKIEWEHEEKMKETKEKSDFRLIVLSKIDKIDNNLLPKLFGLEEKVNYQQINKIPFPQQIPPPQMLNNYQLNIPYQGQ